MAIVKRVGVSAVLAMCYECVARHFTAVLEVSVGSSGGAEPRANPGCETSPINDEWPRSNGLLE